MITKEIIMEAYLFMRKENQSVPSEALEFMKDAALAELQKCKVKKLGISLVAGRSEQLKAFREWYDSLSQEESAWYEGRYEEVFLSL